MKPLALIALLIAASGCSVIRIHDNARQISATAYVPAWPWQDSNQAVNKLVVKATNTNGVAIDMSGSQSGTTTSNNVDLVSKLAEGMAKGFAAGMMGK